MLRAYRLVYLESPQAPPKLWEWQQPYIHHLILNARSFRENARLWEAHYRSCPLYDHVASWEALLAEYREIIRDVQDIYEAHPDWRSPAAMRRE
jgi:hypothetical protein